MDWFAIDWLPMDWHIYILPERWLIYVCQQAKARHAVFSRYDITNEVIRISNNIVVKCGCCVEPGEAVTKKYAAQQLDHRGIVCVPHACRFQDHCTRPGCPWPRGYLFMEYIPGSALDQEGPDLNNSAAAEGISECLAEAVLELSSIANDNSGIPGPVGGGERVKGYLFGDDGTKVVLNSVGGFNH